MEIVHTTVMKQEVLAYLAPEKPDSLIVDCTAGEGGHCELFLQRYADVTVVGIDADETILARARERLRRYGERFVPRQAWFDEFFRSYPLHRPADRILIDLGISMYHFASSRRGFSLRSREPLDMRLHEGAATTAEDLVNDLDERALADCLYRYGEERYSRRIASAIVRERSVRRLKTTDQLAELVWGSVPVAYRHGRIHPATRTFQALRIAVNNELRRLETVIRPAFEHLAAGGRLGVISFHSLEDRIVKQTFRALAGSFIPSPDAPTINTGARAVVATKKPLVPAPEEIEMNAAARSAKLRVLVKLHEEVRQ